MEIVTTRDAREFDRVAGPFLAQRLQTNVPAGILINILDGRFAAGRPVFAYGLGDRGGLRFAALRTPPWPLLCSELDGAGAEALLDSWLREDPGLPGVSALPATARTIAAAWRRRRPGTVRLRRSEAMHALERVHHLPRPAAGELRVARAADRPLLLDWTSDFMLEAGVASAAQAEAMIDSRLERGGMLVWEDGRPVAMVGVTPPVSGVVRIGPVFTPLRWRRRGYAGTAVAAASRRSLAQGASRCLLFTDLANPTANKIYAEIGYRRFADWEELVFDPD
ncbi:MAG: GNAT family N-acetyltransferase [Actinomycetota bacterium]|nr:GNAT family N-acetyltransferase [Actinomycetota bacterium]